MNPVFLVLEVGAAAFFAMTAWLALRRGRLPFLELLSAAAFGLLLEEGDQLIFRTYHYAPEFTLAIDRAPIVIGLSWALILAGAMRITDALGVDRRSAPVVDSVLAIALDLALEAVAIRMGLWTWVGVPLDDGWFGVPAGNFYAWLFVTLAFSSVSRWLRERAATRPSLDWLQLAVPIPAFVVLLFSLVPFILLKPLVDPSPGGGLLLFAITFAAFVAVAARGVFALRRGIPNGQGTAIVDLRLAFATRLAIHLVFLVAMLAMGLALAEPVLLLTSLSLLAFELALERLALARLSATQRSRELPLAAGSPAKTTA